MEQFFDQIMRNGVSVALAFGLGSRDVAAREVEGWLNRLRRPTKTPAEKTRE